PCHCGPGDCLGSCSMNQLGPAIPQLATERKPCFDSRSPRNKSPFRDRETANNKLANPVKSKSRHFSTLIIQVDAGNCLTIAGALPHNNHHSPPGRPVVPAGGVPSPSGRLGMTRNNAGLTLLDAAGLAPAAL